MHFYFFIIIIIKEKKRGQIMEKIYKYFKEINKLIRYCKVQIKITNKIVA